MVEEFDIVPHDVAPPPAQQPWLLPFPVYTSIITVFLLIAIFLTIILLLRRFDENQALLTPQLILSIMVVVSFLGVTAYATKNNLPQNEAAGQLMGGLIGGFTLVLSYWFGPRRPDGG